MDPLSTNPQLMRAANDLAADGRSLDALKREAQRDPRAAVKKAAQQFEAVFMQMVMKSMRDAVPKSGLFDSSQQELYTGMLDQQLATKIAASGTGLADMIARQLTRHLPAEPAATSAASPTPTVAPAAEGGVLLGDDGPIVSQPTSPSPAAPARRAAEAYGSAQSDANRNFVTKHWDHALAAQQVTGIPARFVLSQAALESGWGKSEIRDANGQPSHNLFGIKAGANWQGRTVDVVTTEYENGVAKKVVEKFRAYNNYSEAFRDWAQLLASNPRYQKVLARGADVQGFAQGLQRAGYATDPSYADKLKNVIASVERALGGSRPRSVT